MKKFALKNVIPFDSEGTARPIMHCNSQIPQKRTSNFLRFNPYHNINSIS